jgi:hypothetical protein
MSHTWKFLPIAALFALGAFMLFTGTDAGNVRTAAADDPMITLSVDSDPEGGTGYEFDLDVSGANSDGEDCEDDYDNDTIELDDNETAEIVCDTGAAFEITITVSTPNHSELKTFDCDFASGNDGDESTVIGTPDFDEEGGDVTITYDEGDDQIDCDFDFDFDESSVTPSVTATASVGPAATIVVSSPQNSLGCGATAIVTITVRDSAGKAVPAGALVNIVADKGSVSPTAGQTTADGSVFVFYTAPNNAGGEATITAASGSALGSTEIDINCNIAPTQPPPPTSDVGSGGIQPPNTGDGGLATGNGWHTYAGIALILSSVITTLAVIRPRA